MKCSKLNFHLFLLHVRDSAVCNCGYDIEDENHFLLHCPLFMNERTILLQRLRHVINDVEIDCELLLNGCKDLELFTNQQIFIAVHNYIENTKRL